MGCTRNGTWGDPCEGAVLVNPFVRSKKYLISMDNYQYSQKFYSRR